MSDRDMWDDKADDFWREWMADPNVTYDDPWGIDQDSFKARITRYLREAFEAGRNEKRELTKKALIALTHRDGKPSWPSVRVAIETLKSSISEIDYEIRPNP